MATLLVLPASSFIGDSNAQLVAGDAAAFFDVFKDRPCLVFDDTDEAAAVSHPLVMPSQYTGTGLTCKVHLFSASATSSNFRIDAFVEAFTPGTDTTDQETATSWDTANSASQALASTAGRPYSLSITLTNADSVAAGDVFRLGIRRDSDHADDAATGHCYVQAVEINDDGA